MLLTVHMRLAVALEYSLEDIQNTYGRYVYREKIYHSINLASVGLTQAHTIYKCEKETPSQTTL